MDRAQDRVWRLIVWNCGPQHSGLIARLKLIRARGNQTTYWREYRGREQVAAAIELLRAAGLHGVAKRAAPQQKPRQIRKPVLVANREGFGGRLNARQISGSWRRKVKRG